MRPLAEKYHRYMWKDDFATYGREYYRAYWREVRRLSEGRDVLDYHLGSGWEPLCRFFGKDVPTIDFPRADDLAHYKQGEQK